jgi:hypothetical protein
VTGALQQSRQILAVRFAARRLASRSTCLAAQSEQAQARAAGGPAAVDAESGSNTGLAGHLVAPSPPSPWPTVSA